MEHILENFTECLSREINKAACVVSNTLRTDTFLKNISPLVCKEDGNFRLWLGELEKYFILAQVSEAEKCQAVLLSTRGPIGNYVQTMIAGNPQITWSNIKAALEEYCEELTDPHKVFVELANIRQGRQEGIHPYMDRLLRLARGAYVGNHLNEPIIGNQVKNFFIQGLRDPDIKLAIIKEDPQTVDAAYQKAVLENRWRVRIKTDTYTHEPMEVCHARRRIHRQDRTINRGSRDKDWGRGRSFALGRHGDTGRQIDRSRRFGPPHTIICWECGGTGHIRRYCPRLAPGNDFDPFVRPADGKMRYRNM